ncbi:NAD-dependent epimerase/dehydratase family protein [Leucothrix arctica]|uniref:NAD-dependent dehydratase n=1 Tax=Leucothrix arctica TaxID=1481894 RepID=A0A317CFZ6_9GAMM|nr:NAD(P)-dependent oxidoreductase [Leucothrix arctica]PWQ97061.1 NAD-dependent dehydratase [Leucothrix arctica]
MSRILITGAAGGLGKVLRESLSGWHDTLRLSDISSMGEAQNGEELIQCDLGDAVAVMELVKGCDGIIHLGGQSLENTFENILNANIRGTYNVYEAARQQGVKRILFASSNHVIGFHKSGEKLDATSSMRPDSIYGVSKAYGEMLASYYHDMFGIETAAVRIGSCFPNAANRRMLSTWMSYSDFTSLIKKVFEVDELGYSIVYGVSDNPDSWWDNHLTAHIGWTPKDSSATFANDAHILAQVDDPEDPAVMYQGGGFAAAGHFEDPIKDGDK